MDEASIRKLLETVASGDTPVDEALQALRALPYEELGFAMLDNHRALRWGFPEVVYCPGKTSEQVAQIMERLAAHSSQVLGTRASREQFEAARALVPDLRYDAVARGIWLDKQPDRARKEGVLIAAAGTSDLPVAEEAALSCFLSYLHWVSSCQTPLGPHELPTLSASAYGCHRAHCILEDVDLGGVFAFAAIEGIADEVVQVVFRAVPG